MGQHYKVLPRLGLTTELTKWTTYLRNEIFHYRLEEEELKRLEEEEAAAKAAAEAEAKKKAEAEAKKKPGAGKGKFQFGQQKGGAAKKGGAVFK